jgi:hypothetical protein
MSRGLTSALRYLPAALGVVLCATALALVMGPLAVGVIYVAIIVMMVLVFVSGRARRRQRRESPAEDLERWQKLVHRRQRWTLLESLAYVYIAAIFVLASENTLASVLFAAGMGLFLLHRWLVEPRFWAEQTERKLARVRSHEPGAAT